MTNNLKKYSILLIAAVLLVGLAFAGAASAADSDHGKEKLADAKEKFADAKEKLADAPIFLEKKNPGIFAQQSNDGEYVKVWNGTALQSLAKDEFVAGSSGTATLRGTPGTDDPCVLELDSFVVDASAANTMIIDANVPNLTIKLTGTSDLKANLGGLGVGVIYVPTNLVIEAASASDAKLIVNNTVTSVANSCGIFANNLTIVGAHTAVDVVANSSGGSVFSLYAIIGLSIKDATVNATAETDSGYYSICLDAEGDDVSIADAKVTTNTFGGEYSYGIYAYYDIDIVNSTVNATAESYDDNSPLATALYAYYGNITITDSNIERAAAITGEDGTPRSLYVYDEDDMGLVNLTISHSRVNVTAIGGSPIPIRSYGNLIITNNSSIDAYAYTDDDYAGGYGIYAYYDLDIFDSQVTSNITIESPTYDEEIPALYSYYGKMTIENSTVNADSHLGVKSGYYQEGAYGLFVEYGDDILISNSTVIANATGNQEQCPICNNKGNIIIENSSIDVYGYTDSPDGYGYGIYANYDLDITNSTVNASINGPEGDSSLYSSDGSISISSSSIDAKTISDTYGSNAIYACYGLDIADSFVNTTAKTVSGSYSVGVEAYGEDYDDMHISNSTILVNCTGGSPKMVYADYGNVFIEDSIVDLSGYTDNSSSSGYGIYGYYNVAINASTVNSTVSAVGSDSSVRSYPILAYYYNVTIGNDSVVKATANGNEGYGIVAGDYLVLTGPNLVSAFGTGSSFAFYETDGKDIESLEEGYGFSNETNPGSEPASFAKFNNDWHQVADVVEEYSYYVSNYTSVLINKISVVTLDANGGEGGSEYVNATYGCTSFNITNPTRSGYTFTGWFTQQTAGDKVVETNGNLVADVSGYTSAEGTWINMNPTTLFAHWKQNSQPYTPTPSHKESGQTVIQQQAPVQDVSKDPTPANQATADVTVKYVGQNVIGSSTSDMDTLKQQNPEAAAQMESAMSAAQAAGVPLTNSKGAKAIVVSDTAVPGVEKVTFSRVYEISPANEGEKLTKVTVKVPKSDITAKGLTPDDVTVYHFLEAYNIWQPLEIVGTTSDADNYYYTAATDGTSPFGVLVKKIGETATPTANPTTQPTQKSPAPLAGIIAGLGAAALFLRLRK